MRTNYNYDASGIKYKFPDRSCLICKNYPCSEDLSVLDVDFAKYGCLNYK